MAHRKSWSARFRRVVCTASASAALLLGPALASAQPTPAVTLGNVPSEAVLGESLIFTATFDNTAPIATGYGPYIDIILPAAGVDGAGDETDDGITFVGASYFGTNVSAIVLTFDASGNATHPYARDASNAPLVITGTPGDQLIVLQLPFAGFPPDAPPAPIQITAAISQLADSNVPLTIRANGGFRFGADPVDNPTADPTIVGATVTAPVTPTVMRLRKVYLGDENETVTGPNFPVRYRIEVDIANGQTVADLDVTDVLPDNLQFVSVDATTAGGAAVTTTSVATPSTTTPGGTLTRRFASVTGSTAANDAVVELTAYVPRVDAGSGDVLDPATGAGAPSVDDVRAAGTWTPVDTRDTPGPVVSDLTAADHTLINRPIAVQKRVAVVTDNAPTGPSPTDVLEYTLDLQVSDFFALQNLVVTDVLGDGLRRQLEFAPRLTVTEHGATSPGAMAAPNFSFVTDPTTGETTATFLVSDELAARGRDGLLLGGCVPDGGTGGPPPDCSASNQGPTTLRLTYRVVVQEAYTAGNPVLGGDVIANAVSLTADVVSTSDLTPTGSTTTESSDEGITIRIGQLTKSVYALNGSTTVPSPLVLTPGDVVTFRITGSIPASDTGNITITDFLPAPIFDEAELTLFDPTVSAAAPPAGQAKFGPAETFFALVGMAPAMSTDAGGNSVSFALPDFTDPENRTTVVDLLLTVTATTVPAADGLPVTNLARAIEETTGGSALADAIVQLQLTEPNVQVRKGVVATANPAGVFSPATTGPVTFSAPGSAGYRGAGPITTTGLAATPIDSNLTGVDAGDLVTFAIVLENSGTSAAGAWDVRVRDTLPAGFEIPASGAGLNLQVTNGAGTAVPFTQLGSGLFDPTGGLELTDGATGALAGASPSSGLNIAVITYDLQVVAAAAPAQAITNTATLFNFAGAEGAQDHTGTDRTDDARVTTAPPAATKTLVSTNQAHTLGSNVAIGEIVTYQVLVRVPEGEATGVTLVDTLPAGMAFVASGASAISPGVTISGSTTPIVSPGGQTATITLGTVTNANRDNGADETITLGLTAVVLNGGGNDRGDTLTNTATLSFTGGSVAGSAPAVTVVEPTLQIVKTVTPSTGDGGDTVTFSLVLSHAPGSNADAFEVALSDVVPAGMTFLDILASEGTAPDTIAFAGGAVSAAWTSFPIGAASTLRFRATVDVGIAPGQAIVNTGTSRWTSLPGDVTAPQSPFNGLSTERTGNTSNPGGADNDYVTTGAATFTGRTAAAEKTIVSTSLPSTTGANLAVGERVQYQVQIVIPESTAEQATFVDTLDPGLAFLSFDSIIASPALSTSVSGGFPQILANAVVENVDGGAENDGRRVTLEAGTLVNSDTDNQTVEKITIVYTAVALNTATNVRGAVADNLMAVLSATFGRDLSGPEVTVVEPTLQVVKSAAPTLADAGNDVTFTLTVSHAGASNAAAYNVVLSDVVPTGLTYTAGSLVHVSGVPALTTLVTGATLTVTWPVIAVGETSVFEFRARLDSSPTPVTPGQVITNTGTLTWTSLPGAATTPQSTFNTFSTERTGSTSDPGGAVNTYTASEGETVTVSSSSIAGFVYVDATNDGIKGPMEPGIAGVAVTLTGTDHLGAAVNRAATTLPDGSYAFQGLRPGSYTLIESQPPGYVDGLDTVGTPALGATAGNDVFGVITLPPQTDTTATGFNFGERATVDLSITKIDEPDPVLPGGTLVYTLQVTNAGPNPAFNAVLTDPIPGGTTFVSLMAPAGWTCTTPAAGTAGTVTCSNPTFVPGTADFTLTVAVDAGVVPHSRLNNAATITSSFTDPTPENNRVEEPTVVAAPEDADLEVTKSATPEPVVLGQDVTYTVTVRNNGPATSDATITDTLPAGMTLVSVTPSTGSCSGAAPITCAIPGMAVGATATITIVATAAAPGVQTNTVVVSGSAPDPNPDNNQDDVPTTVVEPGSSDVAVIKTGPPTVARGGNVTYTIVVSNNGPLPAAGVSLGDTPPAAGVTFLANSGDCTTPFPCVLGTLNPGETRRITSTFALSSLFPGNALLNTATVASTTPDSNPANNTSQATSLVASASSADLEILKIDSPDAAVAGTAVVYTMVVTNNGPGTAVDVTVTDDLPDMVTVQSITASVGECNGAGPIECHLGNMASGANATIAVTVLVDPAVPAPGTIRNIATVAATTEDPDPTDNIAIAPTDIVSRADVSVLKTAPATATAGMNVVYTLTVSNAGPSVALNVVVDDPAPPGLIFVSNAGGCATAFPCALGALPVGETRTITSTFAVPSAYVAPLAIVNTSTVTSDTVDPNTTNNSSTAASALVREADLSITKVGPLGVTPGESVLYTITITNAGPSDAINVQVQDPAPPGLSFEANAGDCATAFPCTFATLPVGQSRTFISRFLVSSGYAGPNPILNTATVSAETTDPQLANNSAIAGTSVGFPVADIFVAKIGPALAIPGTEITYTVIVSNRGPSDATDVMLEDPTPVGLTFVSTAGDCTTALPCSFGTLVAGERRTVSITFAVPPDYTTPDPIVNVARVTTTTAELTRSDNEAGALTSVGADLSITKTAAPEPVAAGELLTFVMTATNNGAREAVDMQVVDTLPPGTELISTTPSTGGTCANADASGTVTVTCLWSGVTPSGQSHQLLIVVRVALGTPAGTVLTNTAVVSSQTNDPRPANNTATSTSTVTGPAGLMITKTGPAFTQPGARIAYTLVVTNNGEGDATAVVVEDPTPAGLNFVSNAGDCTTAFPCLLPVIPGGQSRTITSTFDVPADYVDPNPIVNIATLPLPASLANEPERRAIAVTALAGTDVSIVKSGGPSPGIRGSQVPFALVVRNLGPLPADDVTVTDPTPEGYSVFSMSGACTAFPCALGTLAPGDERTIDVVYLQDVDVPAATINTATVTTTTFDPNLANNISSAPLRAGPDLAVTKTGPATAVPGQTVEYTMVVTNVGPSDAESIVVTDPTPPGTTFVMSNGACTEGYPCTIARLRVNESQTMRVVLQVGESAAIGSVIENVVTVAGSLPDPTPANNRASVVTTIQGGEPPCPDQSGLPPDYDPNGDADGDGISNGDECGDGGHPRGFFKSYLPEGATGSFFHARMTIQHAGAAEPAHVLVHYNREGESPVTSWLVLQPGARTTIDLTERLGIKSYSAWLESDVPIAVERTMTWINGGAHADTAEQLLAHEWYFAEGATTGGFHTHYLLQNPGDTPADVVVTFFTNAGPVERTYSVPPQSRTSLWANLAPGLSGMELAVAVRSLGAPIAASRAMYRDWNGLLHVAGSSTSGSSAARSDWYFAEGVASSFFDTWLLLANPSPTATTADITYLLTSGAPITRSIAIPGQSRISIRLNDVDAMLATGAAAMHVRVTGPAPVVAERSVWWPSPNYYEGHQTSGARRPSPAWRFGRGLVDEVSRTYVLIGNFGSSPGQVLVSLTFDNGDVVRRAFDIAAMSRLTVDVGALAPGTIGEGFRIDVASLGTPLPLVAERSIYSSGNGRLWGSGTAIVGTPVIASTLPVAPVTPSSPAVTRDRR